MSLSNSIEFAQKHYKSQVWKSTERPMLYHPLAVASLVLKYGGDADQADAAILHDLICEPGITYSLIKEKFGTEIARLTFAFEDPPLAEGTPQEWALVKKAYLAKVETLAERELLVVLCEELHELNELVTDLKNEGHGVWKRYPVPDRDITWYFRKITEIAYKRRPHTDTLVLELGRLTRALVQFVHEGALL